MSKGSEATMRWRLKHPDYRKKSGEAKKAWLKLKSDPEKHNKRKAYLREWFRNYKRDYRHISDIRFFDGNREIILKRDNYKCVLCGITSEMHKKKYGMDLHVHHLDGRGSGYSKHDRNSELSNLITICVRCHAILHKKTG